MSFQPGDRLGPYEIIDLIGSGGMGEVYRARDPRIGRDVAIKVLRQEFASDADRLSRFQLEAKAAGCLAHPNILAIHDVGQHEGVPYVVEELVPGEALRERIVRGPLPPRKAADIASQIARGLSAAHAAGIVHRDLKPDNVILVRDGRAKILDFGLAKLLEREDGLFKKESDRTIPRLTGTGLVLGTVGYMSPEQVRGDPVGPESDIFCLGVILYEMLTGRRAFHGESAVETMTAILKQDPVGLDDLPPDVPPALSAIVRRCLEKPVENRFRCAEDLAFALETMGSAHSGMAPAIPEPRARRWRVPALVAAGLLLAAGAIAAGRLSMRPPVPSFHQLTFRKGQIRSARFSKDGGSVVYAAAWDGAPVRTYAMRPERPESREVGEAGTELLSVSSEGELLVSRERRFVQLWSASGILARLPLEGGEKRDLLEEVSEADWTPDGTGFCVVRLYAGKSRLEFPAGSLLYETAGSISHPRFSPDGKRIAFLDHPSAGDDAGAVALVDLAGKRKVLSDGWGTLAGLAWSPEGDEIFFTATAAGASRALHAVALSGKRRTVLAVPGTLTLRDIGRNGRVLLSLDKLRLGIAAGVARGKRKERDLSWLDWSHARDLSADGKLLLFDETAEGGGASNSVYLRRLDGSPPVRLGDGAGRALSPDGKRAVANLPKVPKQLLLLPTGTGKPLALTNDSINHLRARFFPDGKRVLFAGSEPGRGPRLYVQRLGLSAAQPITAEGVGPFDAISPDGATVAALDPEGRLVVVPSAGGAPRGVPGSAPGDVPIAFGSDGRHLFVRSSPGVPARVSRLDLSTGSREAWVELAPADAAGVEAVTDVLLTADGATYAYSFVRILSDLYVVDGLK